MATANIKAVITAEDKASPVVSGFGGSVKNMAAGVAIGTLAVQGFTFAMGKLVEAGKFALDSASDFEQNRIAFETMLGSADAARKMLREVSDFAAKTPFELPEVVTGAKQLLAYNIEAGKIIPTFNALGNIAAGVGKDKLPQLILAFGQVRAAGHLTGMELRQFTEAGVPLLDMLAKNFGKTAGEIQDMVSEGKIGFPDVEKAIFGMSQEGGKFFNLMQKQSLTFGGVLSNLSDNIGRVAREIIGISDTGDIRQGSIFYYLSKGANELLTWLDAHKDQIVSFVNNIFEGLKNLWVAIQPAMQQLASIIQTQLMPALQELWNQLKPYAPYLGEAIVIAIIAVIAVIAVFVVTLVVLTKVVAAVVSAFNWLIAQAQALGTWLGKTAADIIRFFAVAYIQHRAFVDGVINNINSMVGTLRAIGGAILQAIIWPWITAFQIIMAGVSGIKSAASSISGGLGGMIGARASGGPVTSNTPYIVGEKGPELFVPNNSGTIVPNNKIGSATSNTTININVGLMTGSAVERREAAAKMFEDLKDIASQRGQTVSQMIGAV